MDAFDPVREAAIRLHDELVAGGVDPLRPAQLAEAAVRRLDLELAWLPPEDPVLNGARALFDEQSGTICCATDVGQGDRSVLVAHELGHVCIHSASSECEREDIDPSRSTAAAPIGMKRVEDYGARERKELQANVFARELLFPRALARRLHLTENLGAATIAARLELPMDLVRQQLLDALLLPSSQTAQSKNRGATGGETHSDASQDLAVAHRGSAFQLQAGPGTGKTRTLVKRVLSLIADGVDPASVLVLTFSNRAAGELIERLTTSAGGEAARLWIGTFHAFGLDLLRRHHDRLALPANPVLFDRSDAIEVLEEILPTLPLVHYRNLWDPALVLRDVVSAISRAKDELVDARRYHELGAAMLARATDEEARETAEKCLEVARIYALYEGALRERGAVDFGDLVMRPTLLLESDGALQKAVQLRHRHVLVDEYQDVNRASARLVRVIADDGRRLWVVGDTRQSIYRFRGASSANMASFAQEYPEAAIGQLAVNYRSSRELVDMSIAFARQMGASEGMVPLSFRAERGSAGARPEVRVFDTPEKEAEGVAAAVRELEEAGVSLRDQAVLCRTNDRLDEIASVLEERGIPVLHLGSLFERDEVRDLLALLSLAIDPFADGLARVGAMARYGMSTQDVYVATRHFRKYEAAPLAGIKAAVQVPELSASGRASLERLAEDVADVSIRSYPWEVLAIYLLDRTRHIADLAVRDTVSGRMRAVAVWQFLNFVREHRQTGSSLPIRHMLDRVRQLVLLAEERDLRQVPDGALQMEAVRMMTVHGSKGLEFEAVHVPGMTVASFPSSNRGQRCPPPDAMIAGSSTRTGVEESKRAHEDEEQCLFFVATTRARTHLRLYRARRQRNGSNRSPSAFLEPIRSLVGELAGAPTLPLPASASRPRPIEVAWPGDWTVTDRHLASYEKCPRRFFYTHVLGLGGARKPTAFSRTHDCLYDLIGWLADARRVGEPSLDATRSEFARLWATRGPVEHAFESDYRRLAERLVNALVRLSAGRRFREAEPLAIDFANGRVVVEPDEMAELPDGTVVLRRVRTGRKRSDEYDRLEYALYHVAARERFGAAYRLEALHLTDESVEAVVVSTQKLSNRRSKSDALLGGIAGGAFPAETDSVVCPRCPHFFVCAAVPSGRLTPTPWALPGSPLRPDQL